MKRRPYLRRFNFLGDANKFNPIALVTSNRQFGGWDLNDQVAKPPEEANIVEEQIVSSIPSNDVNVIALFIKVFFIALIGLALPAVLTYLRFTPGENRWYRRFLPLFITLDGKTRRFWWVWWVLAATSVTIGVMVLAWMKGTITL